jgi:peroxiredoxin
MLPQPAVTPKEIDMTRTSSLTLLALLLAMPLTGCGASKTSDEGKTEKPKSGEPSEPGKQASEPDPAAKADGYQSYLLAALGDLAAGGPPQKAETKAYGCSVKYASDGGEPAAKVGEPAPAFTLPSVSGEQVSLADYAGKTVVLEWFNPDCPFVKYAHEAGGPLATLANEQTKSGIVWLAINSGAPGKQGAGAERNKQAQADWKLEHPVLIDEDGKVGHAYGAQTTPHMFVIDPAGKLIYAGALDNAPLGRVEG